jgi:hypothetical protein
MNPPEELASLRQVCLELTRDLPLIEKIEKYEYLQKWTPVALDYIKNLEFENTVLRKLNKKEQDREEVT